MFFFSPGSDKKIRLAECEEITGDEAEECNTVEIVAQKECSIPSTSQYDEIASARNNSKDIFAARLQHGAYDITHNKTHQPDHILPNTEERWLRHFHSKHKESTEKIYLLPQTPIVNQLNKTLSEQQQKKNHIAPREILTTAKYLTHQGLAFRSYDDISGNFDQILDLRTNVIPELQHFSKNKKNFASCKMQN
ncbi:hypothetical protein PR048_032404 [Dryococelus australis]|uniref:Uncharacterized protein n=1 Tax=Dryococelus australis TaxID=614101 RepID=A0ABQ9G239_9NEOP|nr:hypothetical protein PR048_032404 [Dryococelus australis]